MGELSHMTQGLESHDPWLESRDARVESHDLRLESHDPWLESCDPIFTPNRVHRCNHGRCEIKEDRVEASSGQVGTGVSPLPA